MNRRTKEPIEQKGDGHLQEDDVRVMALDDLADRPYAPVDRDVLAGPDVVGQELDLGPRRGRRRRHGGRRCLFDRARSPCEHEHTNTWAVSALYSGSIPEWAAALAS